MSKRLNQFITVFFIITFLFLIGCDEMNRKYFSQLRPSRVEQGCQYFEYKASTGASGAVCAPGSKNCKVDNSRRVDIWPLDDKQAEQTRMQWLKQSLYEEGYRDADYEIVSRRTVAMDDVFASEGKYSVLYDVRVKRY